MAKAKTEAKPSKTWFAIRLCRLSSQQTTNPTLIHLPGAPGSKMAAIKESGSDRI